MFLIGFVTLINITLPWKRGMEGKIEILFQPKNNDFNSTHTGFWFILKLYAKRTNVYVIDLPVHILVHFNKRHLVSLTHFLMSESPPFTVAPLARLKLSSPSAKVYLSSSFIVRSVFYLLPFLFLFNNSTCSILITNILLNLLLLSLIYLKHFDNFAKQNFSLIKFYNFSCILVSCV